MLFLVLLMLWCWIGSYVNSDLVIRIDAGLLILAAKMITQV